VPRLPALKFVGDFVEVRKKRLDELVKFFAFCRERKRPPLKQCYTKKFFELRDLGADRRLLDAIGNVPHCRHDAAVPGDVIKQFEVMNVH
jgi:hypothetical protein